MLYFNDIKSEQNDIAPNIYFEATVPKIKKNFFHLHMIEFINVLGLKNQKYQNGTVRYENYKGKYLFPIKELI